MFTPTHICLDKILYEIPFYSKSLLCESEKNVEGEEVTGPLKIGKYDFFNFWGAITSFP